MAPNELHCWICGKPKGQPPERCPGHYAMPSPNRGRETCWCYDAPKPCSYHEGWQDALDALDAAGSPPEEPAEGIARRVHIEPDGDGYRWTFVHHGVEVESHVEPFARDAFREGALRAVPAEGGYEQVALIGQAVMFASLGLVFMSREGLLGEDPDAK